MFLVGDDVLVIDVNEYSNNGHNYVSVFFAHPEFRTDEDGKRSRTMKGQVLFNTEGKKTGRSLFCSLNNSSRRQVSWERPGCESDMMHGFRHAM